MAQGELLPVVHKSRQGRRLRKRLDDTNPERVYAAEWLRLNKRSGSYPRGILELLLQSDEDRADCILRTVSQRDAEVAAAVIQWLGTNVGLSLIRRCELKIDEMRDKRTPEELEDRPSAFPAPLPPPVKTRAIDV